MRNWKILITVLVGIVAGSGLQAQNPALPTRVEMRNVDSLMMAYDTEEYRSQETKDKEVLSDLKTRKSAARAEANEARRVGREATEGARKAKNAHNADKEGEKARKEAKLAEKSVLK